MIGMFKLLPPELSVTPAVMTPEEKMKALEETVRNLTEELQSCREFEIRMTDWAHEGVLLFEPPRGWSFMFIIGEWWGRRPWGKS